MNNFFQLLRDIQKKERNTGTLSEIEDTFYDDASKYLQELLEIVNDNPLSLEAYQLRDAQTITTEICERREFKIITTAITNVQKSHNFFKNNDEISKLYEEVPFNTTPEEEILYKNVIDNYLNHREKLSEGFSPKTTKKTETKIGFKPKDSENTPDQAIDLSNNIPKREDGDNLLDLGDISDVTDRTDNKVPVRTKKSSNKLDASEVARMFGQAPDNILTDEENNPVKEKSKPRDIMAPFDPPDVPQYDTVSLQNNRKDSKDNGLSSNVKDNKENPEADDNNNVKTVDDKVDAVKSADLINSVDSPEIYDDELLVEFTDDLTTDILDEDEKTYGPFEDKDLALLPSSLVRILKINNVVNIIK